jgi:hypothetical protein
MQLSAEIRWFGEGAVPEEMARWFRSSPPGGGGVRSDIYLLDPKQPELGIKKRGEKPGLEIKGLVAELPAIESPSLRGRAELWCKWSTLALTFGDAQSIKIEKRRWLRKFDAALVEIELGSDEKPAGGKFPEAGCNVELTEIAVEGAKHWSLGFESFGPWNDVPALLRRTVEKLAPGAPALSAANSLSYPGWLARRR